MLFFSLSSSGGVLTHVVVSMCSNSWHFGGWSPQPVLLRLSFVLKANYSNSKSRGYSVEIIIRLLYPVAKIVTFSQTTAQCFQFPPNKLFLPRTIHAASLMNHLIKQDQRSLIKVVCIPFKYELCSVIHFLAMELQSCSGKRFQFSFPRPRMNYERRPSDRAEYTETKLPNSHLVFERPRTGLRFRRLSFECSSISVLCCGGAG